MEGVTEWKCGSGARFSTQHFETRRDALAPRLAPRCSRATFPLGDRSVVAAAAASRLKVLGAKAFLEVCFTHLLGFPGGGGRYGSRCWLTQHQPASAAVWGAWARGREQSQMSSGWRSTNGHKLKFVVRASVLCKNDPVPGQTGLLLLLFSLCIYMKTT